MASANIINGRLHTPEDENGERQVIMLETDVDHVKDLDSDKTLRELLSEQTYTNATPTQSGLMSAGDKTKLETLYNEKVIVSESDPGVPCMWYEVLNNDEESSK